MDSTAIASFYVASTQAQTSMALQAKLLGMTAEADRSIVEMLQQSGEALEQAAAAIAAPPEGLGVTLDMMV
ncbi:hypothetical protein [Polymorphum gilvum]|nr:hypothetical protein [Polymorphum gilvum]